MITFYMTKKMAIRKTLAHWRRMIVWAMTQDPQDRASRMAMKGEIGEIWTSDHCPLCSKYMYGSFCRRCPLRLEYGACGGLRNAWNSVNEAETWGEWIPAAIKMAAQVESLLYIKR